MDVDPPFALAFNAAFLAILLVVLTIIAISVSARRAAYAAADRFSMRVRLPYGTEATRESVARRLRTGSIATSLTMVVTTFALSPLLLTPVATTVTFMFIVVMVILVATGLVSAVVSIRERLFHPAPAAPRIARPRALRTADYLGPFPRLLPWILGGIATAAVGLMVVRRAARPEDVEPAFAATAVFATIGAVAVFVAMPFIERRVLAQPQPASDTLELAWDDALRTTALGSVRLSAALTAWMALALALGAVWIGSDALFSSFAQQLPTWGVIALTFVYPSNGRRLRGDLYPDWLGRPAPTSAEGAL
ncbi:MULTISPECIES: hypothetical protein [Microbacterium]|uniref:hypothetical protein n=1 Tax=Microbacterium TaxID=33882 RepID=UPI000D6448F4|nr:MULTISPECIES: hypothetical protein [Microbacterium]